MLSVSAVEMLNVALTALKENWYRNKKRKDYTILDDTSTIKSARVLASKFPKA